MTTLKDRITEDMKAAMRGGDKERLGTIRMLQAAIKQREVDERITLDDAQVLAVIEKMVKQRKESIAQFEQGGRADLVAKGTGGDGSTPGLPAGAAFRGRARCADQGRDCRDGRCHDQGHGKVMGLVKAKAAGRADMSAVSARIKAALGA
jgi:uncharacterized protein YqeY